MSYELLWGARKLLEPLLKEAQMKGSTCWGPKSLANVHSGPNLVFRVGDELITISQPGERLKIQEFSRTTDTELGQRVRDLLRKANSFPPREEIFSLSGFHWRCLVCKKTGKVGPGILEETDSRGEGAGDILREAYREHEKLTPHCDPKNVDFYDKNWIKKVDVKEAALAMLEKVG